MKPLFLKNGEIHQASSADQIDSIHVEGSTLSLFDPLASYSTGDVVIYAEWPWETIADATTVGFVAGTGAATTTYYYNPSTYQITSLDNDGSTTPHTVPSGWTAGTPTGWDVTKTFTGWALWVSKANLVPQVFALANWTGPLRFDVYSGSLTPSDITAGAVTTAALADLAVTWAKVQNLESHSLLGNNTASPAETQMLTTSQVRTLLNVEDGANNYTLPAATDSVVGGVKPGPDMTVDEDGVLSVIGLADGSFNIALGSGALINLTSGYRNVALGQLTGLGVETGWDNIMLGWNALKGQIADPPTTAYNNIAIGVSAMGECTGEPNGNVAIGEDNLRVLDSNGSDEGVANVAVGLTCGVAVTSGSWNTYMGYKAGYSSTVGSINTAIGGSALMECTDGGACTAVGGNALVNFTQGTSVGSEGNVAVGYNALSNCTTGQQNVAVGANAGNSPDGDLTTDHSTFIGDYAGYNTTGGDNTAIGKSTMAYSSEQTHSNSTCLGAYAGISVELFDNQVVLGNDDVVNIRPMSNNACDLGSTYNKFDDLWATNTTIQSSDRDVKREIADSDLGLNFINSLRACKFKLKDIPEKTEVITISDPDLGESTHTRTSQVARTYSRFHYGLIAQEVKEVLGDTDFAGYIDPGVKGHLGLRYTEFISPLIKAVQELSARVDSLEA